jgi:hypothetical protein
MFFFFINSPFAPCGNTQARFHFLPKASASDGFAMPLRNFYAIGQKTERITAP